MRKAPGCRPFSCISLSFFTLSGSAEQREGKQSGGSHKPPYINILRISMADSSSSFRAGMLISCVLVFHVGVFTPTKTLDASCLCGFLLCFHISFSAPPPPASSSPRHKLVFLSLPPIPVSFFSPPTIRSSASAFIPLHTFPLKPNLFVSFSFCLFGFYRRLTAESTCVNMSAAAWRCVVGGVCHRSVHAGRADLWQLLPQTHLR